MFCSFPFKEIFSTPSIHTSHLPLRILNQILLSTGYRSAMLTSTSLIHLEPLLPNKSAQLSPQFHLSFASQKTLNHEEDSQSVIPSIEKRNLPPHILIFHLEDKMGFLLEQVASCYLFKTKFIWLKRKCVMQMSRSTKHQCLQLALCDNREQYVLTCFIPIQNILFETSTPFQMSNRLTTGTCFKKCLCVKKRGYWL